MPQFSIIIPCFQQAKYLEQCIGSLIEQSYTDFEILLVDDGSPDNTKEVAQSISKKESRLQYLYKPNGGLSSARNFGISFAKSEYLVFLDSDDTLKPQFLQHIYNKLSSGSDIAITGYSYFNDSRSIHRSVSISSDLKFESIIGSNICPPVSIGIHKSFLEKTGLFDETLNSAEDWDLWVRFFKAGAKLSIINQDLANYRVHEHSMSRNAARMYNALKTVAERNVLIDNRLSDQFEYNRNYPEFDLKKSVQQKLVLCLGVSVKQGLIKESVELFKAETAHYGFTWKPEDFSGMYSYLSFRYYFKKEDLTYFLKNFPKLFDAFFIEIGLSTIDKKKALKLIFQPVVKRLNVVKYGPFGNILNAIFNK
jgi:glycosyltransferase involved in cell wall biosynthesis